MLLRSTSQLCACVGFSIVTSTFQYAGEVEGAGLQTAVGTVGPSPAHASYFCRELVSATPSLVDFHMFLNNNKTTTTTEYSSIYSINSIDHYYCTKFDCRVAVSICRYLIYK